MIFLRKYFFYILLTLVLFGKNFTKFTLIGGLFLFDTLYFILVLVCLVILLIKPNLLKSLKNYKYTVIVSIIALIYLLFSLISYYSLTTKGVLTIAIILRQFVLFAYLLGFIIIKITIFSDDLGRIKLFNIAINIAKYSFYAQLVYSIYNIAIGLRFGEEKYLYLSPLVILGVIVYTGFIIVFERDNKKKIPILVLCLLLSLTFGHSSAYLSVFSVIFLYIFSKFKEIFKLLFLIFCLFAFIYIFFSYQGFTDYNASWRIDVWTYVLKDIIDKNMGIVGNGFGVKYANDQMVYFLNDVRGYTGSFTNKDTDQFISSVHNSFIAMAFHIGALPTMFILLPIIGYLRGVFQGKSKVVKSNEKMFLGNVLLGLTLWCSFNVVLELPHSAVYYWVIYFLFIDSNLLKNKKPSIIALQVL